MSANYILNNPAWLREIPSHWDCKKIGSLFTERKVKVSDKEYPPLSVAKIGVVPQLDTAVKTDAGDNRKLVHIGDFVINSRSDRKGSCGVSELDGSVSLINIVLTLRNLWNSRYVHYLLRSQPFSEEYYRNGRGIVADLWTTRYSEMKSILLPIPPRPEQDQIVRFLDWKVASINKLISIKKKQLVTIQEFINKQFQLIASCSPQQLRLRHIISLCNDFIEISPTQYYMKTGMYNRGRGIFRREAILGENIGDSSFQKIHSDCVMISGQFAWEGATYITTEEDEAGIVSHRYYLLAPKKEVPSEYIWCFLMSDYGQMQMKLCSHGAAGRNRPLNIKELLNVYIPIPQSDSKLNALVRNVQSLMKLRKNVLLQEQKLTEMRNHLISDVVTGKIDVRGIEIPDFEYVEEAADSFDEDDRDMGDAFEDEEK